MVRTYGCIPNEPKIQHSVVDLVLSCISVLVLTGFSVDHEIHEIWWISWPDFMKSTRFHAKDLWFWWKIQHSVVDHTVYLYWFWRKIQQNPVFMKSGGFHGEIQQISWNPVDFMKSGRFHEIRISWNQADFMMKSGSRFHPWNQADFMADLEKCKLENVNFYNAYNFFSM